MFLLRQRDGEPQSLNNSRLVKNLEHIPKIIMYKNKNEACQMSKQSLLH